jgi:hypothetical protein
VDRIDRLAHGRRPTEERGSVGDAVPVAEQRDGTIVVDSEPDRGGIGEVQLVVGPVDRDPGERQIVARADEVGARRTRSRLRLVDRRPPPPPRVPPPAVA